MRLHAVQGLNAVPKPSTALVVCNEPDLDEIEFEDFLQEQEEMTFFKRIKRGLEFLGDWFSDKPDSLLITEYGFLKSFVEWGE